GAPRRGVVPLRVVPGRILPLRVGRLTAQIRVARDQDRRQAAGDARIVGKSGKTELVLRAWRPEGGRVLPRLRPRVAEADFQQRRPIGRPRGADDALAVPRVDRAVAGGAWRPP